MKIYARIDQRTVAELISAATYEFDSPSGVEPSYKAGDEIPIAARFTAEFVTSLIDITSTSPSPECGWLFDGSLFSAPPIPIVDYTAINTGERDSLMAVANSATVGMSDAFVAGLLDATDTASFKAWAAYKLALSKIDMSQQNINWPTLPA